MKKSNKKGFTLVELVVVATIMVIIMGAILNFIQPMNRFYTRTLYNSDSNDVGNILMDKVENELRYSSNIVILEGYKGAPKVNSEGYLVDEDGFKVSTAAFTNVLVIDNYDFRSYEDNVAHRKGATGYIAKYDLGGTDEDPDAGYIMESKEILGTPDLYTDMKCTFGAYLNTQDSANKCVQISMDLKKPEFGDSGKYEFNKTIFTQTRDLKLVNINLVDAKVRKMTAEYYSDTNPNADSINYTKFPNADLPLGYTPDDGTKARYDGDHEYTYIFYTVIIPTQKDATCTITLYDKITNELLLRKEGFKPGSKLTPQQYAEFETVALNKAQPKINGDKIITRTYSGIVSGTFGELNEYVDSRTIDVSMDFFAEYIEDEHNYNPIGRVEFYDRFTSGLVDMGVGNYEDYDFVEGFDVFPIDGDPTGNNNKIPFDDGGRASNLVFNGWYTIGSLDANGQPKGAMQHFIPTVIYSHDYTMKFYASYEPSTKLEFYYEDGATHIKSMIFGKSASGNDVLNSTDYIDLLTSSGLSEKAEVIWDVDGEGKTLDQIDAFPNETYKIVLRVTAEPEPEPDPEPDPGPGGDPDPGPGGDPDPGPGGDPDPGPGGDPLKPAPDSTGELVISSKTTNYQDGWKNTTTGAGTYTFTVTFKNTTDKDIKGGKIVLTFDDNIGEKIQEQYSNCSATFTISGNQVVIEFLRTGGDWSKIAPGAEDSFTIAVRPTGPNNNMKLTTLSTLSVVYAE